MSIWKDFARFRELWLNPPVWDDIVGSLIGRQLFSTAGKIDYNFEENAITMAPGGVITTTNDCIIFNLQYPHAGIVNGEMHLHVHWEQTSANNIIFTTQYRIQSNGETKATAWQTVVSANNDNGIYDYTSGTLNQITELAIVDLTGKSISSTVQFRIARTDSTLGDINATFIDAHIARDTVGSRTEYVK